MKPFTISDMVKLHTDVYESPAYADVIAQLKANCDKRYVNVMISAYNVDRPMVAEICAMLERDGFTVGYPTRNSNQTVDGYYWTWNFKVSGW